MNELREPFHHWIRTLQAPSIERRGLAPGATSSGPRAKIARSETRVVGRGPLHRLRTSGTMYALTSSSSCANAPSHANRADQPRCSRRSGRMRSSVRRSASRSAYPRGPRGHAQDHDREARAGARQDPAGDAAAHLLRDASGAINKRSLRGIEEELQRRQSHYQQLLESLQRDQERVLEHVLPDRYRLRGNVSRCIR